MTTDIPGLALDRARRITGPKCACCECELIQEIALPPALTHLLEPTFDQGGESAIRVTIAADEFGNLIRGVSHQILGEMLPCGLVIDRPCTDAPSLICNNVAGQLNQSKLAG